MEEAGQPAPEYRQNEFMVYATIRQHGDVVGQLNGGLNGELNGGLNGGLNGDDSVNDSRNDSVNDDVNGEVNSLTPSPKLVFDTVHDNPGINTKKISGGDLELIRLTYLIAVVFVK